MVGTTATALLVVFGWENMVSTMITTKLRLDVVGNAPPPSIGDAKHDIVRDC